MPGITYRPPLPSNQVWTPPEIDFFDVPDELEQKKIYICGVKLGNFSIWVSLDYIRLGSNVKKLLHKVRM